YNELLEENKSLKSKISDLKRDVSLIYESTKEFLKERTDGLKAFKNVFKGFVDKVKDKTAQFQEKHDLEPKKNEFKLTHNREVKKGSEKVSFFDCFELVLSYLDTYRNNVIFILVAERCVEVLVCMCFKVLKTLKIGCTEKPHLLKL